MNDDTPKTKAAEEALLEVANLKKPSKGIYMGLYYLMMVLSLSLIGYGASVTAISGLAGRASFGAGVFYFIAAVVLIVLAIRFRAKAQ